MHDSEKLERRNVAVIGSGVAGLTAAYVLSRHDRVTLYEADARLGGHAHTHHLALDSGAEVDVDTGFIVHNDRTYPPAAPVRRTRRGHPGFGHVDVDPIRC